MARDLMQMMRRLFLPADTFQEGYWQPSVDVYRTPEGCLVKLDLAGVRPEDVSVRVAGRRMKIKGIRRDWSMNNSCRCYRLEIAYSHFERDIELPVELEPAYIDTEYREGMLLVRITSED